MNSRLGCHRLNCSVLGADLGDEPIAEKFGLLGSLFAFRDGHSHLSSGKNCLNECSAFVSTKDVIPDVFHGFGNLHSVKRTALQCIKSVEVDKLLKESSNQVSEVLQSVFQLFFRHLRKTHELRCMVLVFHLTLGGAHF